MADSNAERVPRRQRHGIYVASKCRHAEKWKALRADGWPIISSWLDESEPGQTNSFADLWARNIREASGAAAVIFYVEPGETMKGSLVEIGAAMAHGVPVYGVGTPEDCTFREHPAFFECALLDDALKSLAWVIPPSAPDALGEAIKIIESLHSDDCHGPGCHCDSDKALSLLRQARAAHAEEIAAARAEVEGLKKERDTPGSYYDLARAVIKERDAAMARAEKAERSADRLDSMLTQEIETREVRDKMVEELAADLGCSEEWTNLHDHYVCVTDTARTLRASLSAAQVREAVARELVRRGLNMEDMATTTTSIRHGREMPGHEVEPGAGVCRTCSWRSPFLHFRAALSQPAPAVPEAAPRMVEVERIKVLEEALKGVREFVESVPIVLSGLCVNAPATARDAYQALEQIDAALSAPAKEGK